MAEEVRRVVNVQIGQPIEHPKFGLDVNVACNDNSTKAHLEVLPTFNNEACYMYIAIQSHNAQELKASFEETYSTILNILKETGGPEYELLSKTMSLDFGIHGDLVIIGVNIKDNEAMQPYIQMAETVTQATIKGEARVKGGVYLNIGLNEIITLQPEAIFKTQFNVHLTADSQKSDKYAFKQLIYQGQPLNTPEDKLGKLFILMFSAAEFTVTNTAPITVGDLGVNGVVRFWKGILANLVSDVQKVSSSDGKRILEQMPFIQNLIDSLEQYGSGVLKVGYYCRGIDVEADLYCTDLAALYQHFKP